jgi:hypothetical protein
LTEIDIGSTESRGIDMVYDERGLHLVWADIDNTYYERYRRTSPFIWEAFQNVTDEPWNYGCGKPSIALSENRIHVAYNYTCYALRTRDYNFVTQEWEPSQLILHETPPPPDPTWTVVDYSNWGGARVAVFDNYLHTLEVLNVTLELPPGGEFTNFLYLYDNKRPLDSDEWTDETIITKLSDGTLLPRFINTDGKLNTIVRNPFYTPTLLLHYDFYENSWHYPSIIIRPDPTINFCYSGNDQSVYVYWSESGSNQLHYSYSMQNPVISLEVNPFLNKQQSFFEYEPVILYSILDGTKKTNTFNYVKEEGVIK